MKPSVVCFINTKTVRQIIQDTPALGLSFLARAAEELGDAEEKYHESVTLSIRARSNLAAMLGVQRESISRIIHELDSRGITKFAERKVIVPDPDSLMKECHKE